MLKWSKTFVIWAATYQEQETDKEFMIRIGKAATVFGRLVNIWKSKNISLAVKIRLYESLVISNWEDSTVITAEGTNVEVVEDFCYLVSYLSRTGQQEAVARNA